MLKQKFPLFPLQIPHKGKNKGKYISFHCLMGWKACKIRKVQEISPQISIYFTHFNIKLNLIALIKTRIINHSALHYHRVPKKCPTSPPTILPVSMRLCRLFILFILKSHFSHSQTMTLFWHLVNYGKKEGNDISTIPQEKPSGNPQGYLIKRQATTK